ncbi:MAG: RtcB family protein, partial [Candidatus Heimdallarchaeota archaeon]|nr:RtcB family protein [Candidatus Heimdallarchaeota archaeon]
MSAENIPMRKINEVTWEIPTSFKKGMRVPARMILTPALKQGIERRVVNQITNVATLPGIQKYALALPDAHAGYGFPIGGVAAFDMEEGVISPGGIGFDINCGMRLITTNLTVDEVRPKIRPLVNTLYEDIPTGVGKKGPVKISMSEFQNVVETGS